MKPCLVNPAGHSIDRSPLRRAVAHAEGARAPRRPEPGSAAGTAETSPAADREARLARTLVQDLALEVLAEAMGAGDEFVAGVALDALLAGPSEGPAVVAYRQEVLRDGLANADLVRELYALAVEPFSDRRPSFLGLTHRYPSSVLYDALDVMKRYLLALRKLRAFADKNGGRCRSQGLAGLCATLQRELTDEYLAEVEGHLATLRFPAGKLLGAQLGQGNEGVNYLLRQPPAGGRGAWYARLFGRSSPHYTFRLHPRDEQGARALSDIGNRGINLVANALAQSADHVRGFFDALRTEVAFYVGALNLHERMTAMGAPLCVPELAPAGSRTLRFEGLYDICLALRAGRRVVGNTLNADGKRLLIITGANQGGKSTFLRGLGVAHLMMQCGLVVAADAFSSEPRSRVVTHYKREEDTAMAHGKFDEELARMSEIAEVLAPGALVLFNESFASTNEREGAEIARQVVTALTEKRITVGFVTHLYAFARGLFEQGRPDAVFLRPERTSDGTRTYRLREEEPLETSFGLDVFREVFGAAGGPSPAALERPPAGGA
jgi:hypothetical protein